MNKSISYVIPIFNEEKNLNKTISRIKSSFEQNCLISYEIIFVDDGSTDNTLNIIKSYIDKAYPITCISLTRNFGHQAALTAGLNYAKNDLVAVLDGDLQDPPEVINSFLSYINNGYDVVYGVRKKRKEIFYKVFAYKTFYQILSKLSNIEIPLDSGDFCLLTKKSLNAINSIPEKNRFIRGIRSYIGLKQIGVSYERDARYSGEPKYTFNKLLKLASDGIFNFSDKPLKITSAIGILISFSSLIVIVALIIQNLFSIEILGYSPNDIPGYTSIIISNIFISGIQLFALGIIGEYVSRIFLETKNRPAYLIREIIE